ncbi:MAG: EutP/PduV family microcompartment system protein [Treponema sp.]|jgi:ethanolamine utilization protein EutP|nr:EutP/PduV family microcompartment system protein [Treponema sp.]
MKESPKLLVAGPVFSGKTTLCRNLANLPQVYVKTHAIEIVGNAIDTPGEYIENRCLWHRLKVTSCDAELVLFLQDAVNLNFYFVPGQASMFNCPVAGVVTKKDLAGPAALEQAGELLTLAGASPCFTVSLLSGEGMDVLREFIASRLAPRQGGRE